MENIMHHHAIDYVQVWVVNTLAFGINIVDVADWLKVMSLGAASGYTLWKWRMDYLGTKKKKK